MLTQKRMRSLTLREDVLTSPNSTSANSTICNVAGCVCDDNPAKPSKVAAVNRILRSRLFTVDIITTDSYSGMSVRLSVPVKMPMCCCN